MMITAHRIDILSSIGRLAAIGLIAMTSACGGGDTALPSTSSQRTQNLISQPQQRARLAALASTTVMPAIAVGLHHSLALRNDGTVWSWGNGGNGELGNNSTSNSLIPVQVVDPSGVGPFGGVTSIAAGQLYSMALKSDGTVWSWGYGGNGTLGNNSNQNSSVPVQVVGSGGVGSLGNVTAIAISANFSVALKNDGTVWTWGIGGWGELGNGDTGSKSSLVPVQVVGPGGVGILTGVTAISAGYIHAMALRSDGTVWDWGNGQSFAPVQVVGAGGVGTLGGVTAIAAGSHHSLTLKNDGTVWSWGYGGNGALGNNSTSNSLVPVQVLGPGGVGVLAGVTAIAVGEDSSLALKNDGTVWAWGYGVYGDLGNNSTSNSLVPVQVVGPSGVGALGSVAAIAAHFFHPMALKSDGTVWSWGYGGNGELGNNSTSNSLVPVQVVGPGGVGFLNLGAVGPVSMLAQAVIPQPTATPPIVAFPTSFAGFLLFIQNHGTEFSPETQTFLTEAAAEAIPIHGALSKGIAASYADLGKKTAYDAGILNGIIAAGVCPATIAAKLTGVAATIAGALPYLTEDQKTVLSALKLSKSSIEIAEGGWAFLDGNPLCIATTLSSATMLGVKIGVVPALEKFANDPPDPLYTTIATPQLPYLPSLPLTNDASLDTILAAFVGSTFRAAALLEAVNTSYDRYSTALMAGDTFSATRQLGAALKYLVAYDAAVRAGGISLAKIDTALHGNLSITPAMLDQFLQIQQSVALYGLPSEITALLMDSGFSSIQIDMIKAQLLGLDSAGLNNTNQNTLAILSKVFLGVSSAADVDRDGDVDSSDLARINAALNTQAAGPNDLRDLDGDGKITGLDARKLVTLCTRPRCATQ